jgi:basic amino acid/polyamine antiporter, APA family
MTTPTVGLTEQMLRRRPVLGAPVAHGASTELKRTIGTFQLTLFGVGATVGTGIFFVLSAAVPEAGPAVMISFLIAGIAFIVVSAAVIILRKREPDLPRQAASWTPSRS